MTTELIILLFLTGFLLTPLFNLPKDTFQNAGSYLGGRIERQLSTGAGFQEKALDADSPLEWGN